MAGEHSVVYVETERGRFEFREIEVGQIVGYEVSITEGLKPGESVVASATMLLDSQFSMAGKPSLIDPTKAIPREPEPIDPFSDPEVILALSTLSESDREAVKRQRLCPVADQILGSMGTPIKIDVKGQAVFVCCDGCSGSLQSEPDKYLEIIENRRRPEKMNDGRQP